MRNCLPILPSILLSLAFPDGTFAAERAIPRPAAGHPGNIFLVGEDVVIPVPESVTGRWQLRDYDDRLLAELQPEQGLLALGQLSVGWYRLRPSDVPDVDWISLGVLAPLRAPTPRTSPIGSDVAMAWFYPPPRMEAVANLSALAGLNWVRDRLNWAEIQPQRGELSPGPTRYDASAEAQATAGLQVLQVNHISPPWANPHTQRLPPDLRDAYGFYRDAAARWRGKVLAFEPWNEADIEVFGGHTGSEIAAFQKACYLGLKAGNPQVIVCQNVFAAHRRSQLDDFQDNQAWPYFDTFNLHHYASFESYPALYADFRAVSAGRPLWVTECSVPVKWAGEEKRQEPTDGDLRQQAERLAKTFALSLHERSAATFFFILGHYVEGPTQFGIIRRDLTPRPAYLALAAVGRLLADAQPLGRVQSADSQIQAYLFRARPDGEPRQVLVAWSSSGDRELNLPAASQAVFDHLGRSRSESGTALPLTTAPTFALFAEPLRCDLQPPPESTSRLPGAASPVVLQAVFPAERTVLQRSACRISAEKPEPLSVWAYNFSDKTVRGKLHVRAPEGWRVALQEEVELPPLGRRDLELRIDVSQAPARLVDKLQVTGDFGEAGRPVLTFQLMPEPYRPSPTAQQAIPRTKAPAAWEPQISGPRALRMTAQDGGVLVDAEPRGEDRWVYPRCQLADGEQPPAGCRGLACTLTVLEGETRFRVIFEETGGSCYVAELLVAPKPNQPGEAIALFEGAAFGSGWSPPDPNHRLDLDQIQAIKVGGNTRSDRVRFLIQDLRWISL